tara:strand:- start:53 stop:1147 length:1095 start_codon:yes stop_codon:yes gene_type:complete
MNVGKPQETGSRIKHEDMKLTDAGRFYALLRFEEASLALRAVLRMGLVDQLRDRSLSRDELRDELGFTVQAARTFFALLQVMQILEIRDGRYCVTTHAGHCLATGTPTSRKPYLSMGTGDDVDALLDLLKGNNPEKAIPLYSGENAGETIMDDAPVAREIALGLSSRARNFADPLAEAVAGHASNAKTLADIGAGSPYVAQACLRALPNLDQAILVDRANGMRFAHEIIRNEQMDASRLEFHEGDFFDAVPTADIYLLSNTAHDWRPPEYSTIADNIRNSMPDDGLICIHEPILMTSWNDDTEWIRALWMACYALTLLRFTLGEGTCYSIEEHHEILSKSGFVSTGPPVPTADGCTALFFRKKN